MLSNSFKVTHNLQHFGSVYHRGCNNSMWNVQWLIQLEGVLHYGMLTLNLPQGVSNSNGVAHFEKISLVYHKRFLESGKLFA